MVPALYHKAVDTFFLHIRLSKLLCMYSFLFLMFQYADYVLKVLMPEALITIYMEVMDFSHHAAESALEAADDLET